MFFRCLTLVVNCALLFVAVPATGQTLSIGGQLFRDVCVLNAPQFSDRLIREAARLQFAQQEGVVEFKPGESCKVVFSQTYIPQDAELQSIAVEFARRVGGTIKARKSAFGGIKWYQIRVGNTKYGVEGGLSRNRTYYMIAKR